jgi:twitching motility protein PilT
MSRLDELARALRAEQGQTLHVHAGKSVCMRAKGQLVRLQSKPLSADELMETLEALTDARTWDRIQRGLPTDFPCELAGAPFRAHAFWHRGGPALILKATAGLTSFAELGLPRTVERLAHLRRGLVLFTGPTGAGKTTAVNALFKAVEEGRSKHVVTLESPIELTVAARKTSFSRREVGSHIPTFADGLRASLRQGADIVYTSDIPDADALSAVIEVAASGALVVSCVAASSAVRALERLVANVERRPPLLHGLAEHFSAAVSLLRLPCADGIGHCVAAEILLRSRHVVAALHEDRFAALHDVMAGSERMRTMDDALLELLDEGRIAFEDAYAHARDKTRFRELEPRGTRAMRRTRRADD